MPARWLSRLHRFEDGLLAALLGSLLLLSVAQIVLRVAFDAGLPWAEPVSRAGVLFLALLGALGATRSGKHIAIDALPRFLPPRPRRVVWAISQVAAAVVCLALAWLGWGMVGMEREAPVPFVAGIPSWVPMLVIPLGFGLMGLRFLVAAWVEPPVATLMGVEP
ncbi:MAG: TRAP transporter small permease [Arenimonas sp.]|jgi:TRAP-type C4-dicarboxylate transport system permease small subunit|nr:TRAP transporter small permease [Arenimonas sp.]